MPSPTQAAPWRAPTALAHALAFVLLAGLGSAQAYGGGGGSSSSAHSCPKPILSPLEPKRGASVPALASVTARVERAAAHSVRVKVNGQPVPAKTEAKGAAGTYLVTATLATPIKAAGPATVRIEAQSAAGDCGEQLVYRVTIAP
jgi:hypothetical protein